MTKKIDMIHPPDFIRMLENEHNVLKMQTAGLTTADTLIQPQPGGNCMNWVLGHLLDNQVTLLKVLDGESPASSLPFDSEALTFYRRESEPIRGEGLGVLPLERLLEGHAAVHAKIIARLGEMQDADFDREIPWRDRTISLGWRVFFLQFHLTYHLGQLELLRQLAGHTEKII